jgi:hypothetical protein
MLVGIVAGLLSFGFLKVYGEPQVDRAIAFESQHEAAEAAEKKAQADAQHGDHEHAAHEHTHEHAQAADAEDEVELVSRPMQAGLGLLVGVVVYSAAFGGLFGLAFAFAYGRVPGTLTPQAVAVLLAAAGFVAIYLVPNLKYPANPPSVGNPETIGTRTALYFIMIALSLAAMIAAFSLRRICVARFGAWNGTLVAAAGYVVFVVVVALLLPAINEVPDAFPAVVLWQFRVASIGAQLIMWATFGLLFGALTQRTFSGDTQRA